MGFCLEHVHHRSGAGQRASRGNDPFIVWGFHPLWHGDQYRPQLDALFLDRPFKLQVDGAIFGGLSQADFPGYIDGHVGQWLVSANPYDVGAEGLRDIAVKGVVFEGEPHPL